MVTPTPDEVRAVSPLLVQRYPDDAENDAKLQAFLDVLAPIISWLTGRSIGPADVETPGVEVPDWLKPIAVRVFALRAERDSVSSEARRRKTAAGSLRIRSFTAGPYSESYFGPEEAGKIQMLDPEPGLHELLWALATEEKRAYWTALWTGEELPAAAVQAFDYGARGRARERRSAIRLGLRGPRF